DALVVDGAEAGGHPPPSEVGTLVLVRRVLQVTKLPVVASGGIADGAGIAAMLTLGAEAVQLGTRFIATPEASVHENYKRAVLEAEVDQTTLVGRGTHPIRQLKNAFSAKYEAAERTGASRIRTLNRPEKRNALDTALSRALLEALRAADADETVRCVVLTGAGPAFCAGADLAEFKGLRDPQAAETRAELTMQLHLAFS